MTKVERTVFRIRDPKTGLFWNNLLGNGGGNFVTLEQSAVFPSERAVLRRVQDYNLYHFTRPNLMEKFPKEVECVEFRIIEEEQRTIGADLDIRNIIYRNFMAKHENDFAYSYSSDLSNLLKDISLAKYPYLVVFNAEYYAQVAEAMNAIRELRRPTYAFSKKQRHMFAVRGEFEIFAIKSLISTGKDAALVRVAVYDLREYMVDIAQTP